MVAIQHDTVGFPVSCPSPGRARLRVIEGGRSPARLASTYRRRRLAALVAVAVVALLAVLGALTVVHAAQALVQPAAPAAASAGSAAPHTVVVQPGDTLWAIAERLPHHGDVRPLVDQLAALNGGSQIHAGQRLVVPGG